MCDRQKDSNHRPPADRRVYTEGESTTMLNDMGPIAGGRPYRVGTQLKKFAGDDQTQAPTEVIELYQWFEPTGEQITDPHRSGYLEADRTLRDMNLALELRVATLEASLAEQTDRITKLIAEVAEWRNPWQNIGPAVSTTPEQ